MRGDFAKMMGGVTPEMRSVLPADFENAYYEKCYFSVLAKVVQEREDAGAASSRKVMEKVQPEEGCDDAAEVERRRALLKVMTPSMFGIVDTDVKNIWKAESDAQAPALRSLLPVDPPREFWVAQYYRSLERVVAKAQSEFAGARAMSGDGDTARGSDSRAILCAGAVQAESGDLSSQARQAAAGAFGMQAIMDDTAYDQAAVIHSRGADIQFASSSLLLSDAEIGPRV